MGTKIFLVAGLLISALMLVIGSLGGAVAFTLGTGLIWMVWRFEAGSSSDDLDAQLGRRGL